LAPRPFSGSLNGSSGSVFREGLVDGGKLFLDTSLIQADASNNSVADTENLQKCLYRGSKCLEGRLEEDT